MREFFGFGGYNRTPEGFLSWQHLLFVTIFMAIMVWLAAFLGLKNKDKDMSIKNKVLMWAAIIVDALEIIKIVIVCIRGNDAMLWRYNLPLFLCSIQLITIPLAAFAKGRVKEAALDFVFIFGILGAVLGTYGADQNFNANPVLSFDNCFSVVEHAIAGFASLYIGFAKMTSMKSNNIIITFAILLSFCVAAYAANHIIDYNYMFLMRGDGTPYDIFYNMVNGSKILYPLVVVFLFLLYVSTFYLVFFFIKKKKSEKIETSNEPAETSNEPAETTNETTE